MHKFKCLECTKSFTAQRRDALYCSPACRMAAKRRRDRYQAAEVKAELLPEDKRRLVAIVKTCAAASAPLRQLNEEYDADAVRLAVAAILAVRPDLVATSQPNPSR